VFCVQLALIWVGCCESSQHSTGCVVQLTARSALASMHYPGFLVMLECAEATVTVAANPVHIS
jgi:hypothetical protein